MYIVAEYGEWCLKANGGWWPAAGCHRTPPHARRWGRRSLDDEVLPHLLTRSPAVSKLALKYSKSTTTAPASGVAVAVVLPLHQQQQRLSSEWVGYQIIEHECIFEGTLSN
ncbi:uncharacterized protein LOC120713695 isoform X2 [Panicum virgatum]|uniref:uncharacterized protein LOC120713695 isoform X2 n=1 Tax=Panicum virgatum TaxID=38727 RepID=UPI0019D643EA|nr:uncharacterized protein LOC120713695 isoform X2 [Panicum virgatum]